MQNAQEIKERHKKTNAGLCVIHEKKENLLTKGNSMIKSNPNPFCENLAL